jgi:SAM-dependent methyltransferase
VAADLRQLAATGIPFPEAYFDCVVAWQVLGYNDWETLQQAMAEIRRVLRPGGLFIGTITAAGDVSQGQATPLGDGLYCSRVAGQAGAIVLIVDEKDLARCFPGQTLTVGETLYRFDSVTSRHFIVSFNVETDGRGLV